MIWLRYCCRLYLHRWALTGLMSLAIVGLLERLNPKNTWLIFITKLPFHLHNMMPFLLLVAALVFAWHLVGNQQWWAMNGVGVSDLSIMRAPMLCATILLLIDATLLVPMGARFFNPFQSKNTMVGVNDTRWRKMSTKSHHILWKPGSGSWVIVDPKNDHDLPTIIRATTSQQKNNTFHLSRSWTMRIGEQPVWKSEDTVVMSSQIREEPARWHPLLLSLHDAVNYWWSNPMNKVISLRVHYWMAHIVWALGLVAWVPLLVVNMQSVGFRIAASAAGIGGSLVLYVGKEWLYAMSLPWSASYHPLGLWLVPLLTWALVWFMSWMRSSTRSPRVSSQTTPTTPL